MDRAKAVAVLALAMTVLLASVEADITPDRSCNTTADFLFVPNTVKNISSYDASKVDWAGYMNAIDCIGKREHTFCTFVTRMFFHDSAAVDNEPATSLTTGSGSDGSILVYMPESIYIPNNHNAEGSMVRYSLRSLIGKYGMSWSDGLNVAAAVCTNTLGSKASIQNICEKRGIPFYVNKKDKPNVDLRNNLAFDLPGNQTTVKEWLTFWRVTLNAFITEDKWKFEFRDIAALMGSHAMNIPHGCTKSSSGKLRSATFDNSYFKDALSGDVYFSNPNDKKPDICLGKPCVPTTAVGESAGCIFDTANFGKKTGVAKAQADDMLAILIGPIPLDPPQEWINWVSDKTRAACFGAQCNSCLAAQTSKTSSRPWCRGRMVGESFWPYTVNDAHLAMSARAPKDADTTALSAAWKLFRKDLEAFRHWYAVGSCKLNNVAAHFGKGGPLSLYSLVGKHIGKCEKATPADKKLISYIFDPLPCL